MTTQQSSKFVTQNPQHVMLKLQIYNQQPHFGKGLVSLMLLIQNGHSLRSACSQMGLAYSKAWRLLKNAENDLGFPILNTQKGGAQHSGSKLTPEGEELLHRYIAFEQEAQQAVLQIFNKYFQNIY